MGPVHASERIASLDIMRGLAVLGILAVNAAYFAAPWQTAINPLQPPLSVTPETLWTWALMHVVFEYKFITMFSLLFGASLCMVGGVEEDAARAGVLWRRLLWLLLFGAVHGALIWNGDILLAYALTGMLVAFARKYPARVLIMAGVGVYVLALAMQQLSLAAMFADARGAKALESVIWALPLDDVARMRADYQGGLVSATHANASLWAQFLIHGLPGLMTRTAGVMLIGMALFKWGFLSARAPAWLYALLIGVGALALGVVAWQAMESATAQFAYRYMYLRGMNVNAALSILVTLGYVGIIALAVKGGLRVRPLAAVGRMAFTNYIAQSLIMTTIFWGGRGFGLYGEVDRLTLWAIVLMVWAAQLVWSPLWLAHFRMGPLEWLWRRLSYAKPVAIGKETSGGNA